MLRVIKAFFPAVLVTYIVASILATWSVMDSLRQMGVAVDMGTQLQATWHDMLGMSSSYLVLILVAFLLAFPAAAGLVRITGRARLTLFVLAGSVALLVMHLLLSAILQITPIAAARTPLGLLGQCVAGGLGAWVYCLLSRSPPAPKSAN